MSSPSVYQGTNRYTQDLRQQLQRAQLFIRDPDFALSKDERVYEKIRRDAVVAHAIQYRKHLVAGREWFLEAADEDSRALLPYFEDLIHRIRAFAQSRFNLAEAVFQGMSVAKIGGRWLDDAAVGADRTPRRWWALTELVNINKQRLRQEFRDVPTGREYFWTLFDPERNAWERIEDEDWFVWHLYDDTEEALGHGRGLASALYYYWFAKTHVFEYGLAGAERWAEGWVVAMIDGMIGAAPGTATNSDLALTHQQRVTEWTDILKKMKDARVAVFDSRDKIEVLEPQGTGHQIIKDFLAYLDDAMRVLILGANLPTSATTGGSFALAQVQENSTEALVAYDRELLEETLTRDVIGALWRYNRPTFAALGLGHLRPPRFRIRPEQRMDASVALTALQGAQLAGLDLQESEVFRRLGWTRPDGSDRTIRVAPPAPPAQVGG